MPNTSKSSRLRQKQGLKKLRKDIGLKEPKSYDEYLKAEKERKSRIKNNNSK